MDTNKIAFGDEIIKQIFEKLQTADKENKTHKRHLRKLRSRIAKSVKVRHYTIHNLIFVNP